MRSPTDILHILGASESFLSADLLEIINSEFVERIISEILTDVYTSLSWHKLTSSLFSSKHQLTFEDGRGLHTVLAFGLQVATLAECAQFVFDLLHDCGFCVCCLYIHGIDQ